MDVSTWGVAVIGQPLLDNWFGFGASFRAWEKVKEWGGFYGQDGSIWGVGYSDQDANGILSGEWTAGAINLVRVLIAQYKAAQTSSKYTPEQQTLAQEYVEQLAQDEQSMVAGLETLRSDQYASEGAYDTVRPDNYSSLINLPSDNLAYIYASKRYMTPFGWQANPLPSTASTAWAVMVHYNYNPFTLGGGY